MTCRVPSERAAGALADFASAIHAQVPDSHSIDLHTDVPRERGICGDHGRVVPTRQRLCPVCAGRLTSIEEVERLIAVVKWGTERGLYDAAGVARMRREKYKPVRLRKKRAA
jgi:transcriptional regulator NrdR family protein